jgi:Cu(I)/Ag(I) efflux system membrane fusion protein
LKEGDRIVVSANFLVDSESSLKAALDAMSETPAAPTEHKH